MRAEQAPATMELLLDGQLQWTLESGWVSPTYGHRDPRTVVRGQRRIALPVGLTTVFWPSAPTVAVERARALTEALEILPEPIRALFANAMDRAGEVYTS